MVKGTIYFMGYASGTQQEGQMFLIFIMIIIILLLRIYLMTLSIDYVEFSNMIFELEYMCLQYHSIICMLRLKELKDLNI